MNIRSVTAFVDASHPVKTADYASIGDALHMVRDALTEAGFTVQTTRLATQPFSVIGEELGPADASGLAKDLEAVAFVQEIDYVSIGPVQLSDPPTYVDVLADVLGNTDNVFASIEIANHTEGISIPRARRTAALIKRVAGLTDDGFKNLNLTAAANVRPWSPFFPAGFHGGGTPCIAIATESADLAVTAVSSATTLAEARSLLVSMIEEQAGQIGLTVEKALRGANISYRGIDFSLAPFPEETRSIGGALEKLGLSGFGDPGSLIASAFMTDAIERAEFPHTGFCGLMLPVLEDAVLAERVIEGRLNLTDLLLYSAVCGTGLDTIPVPGDVSDEALMSILLDVAALALRLNKPLTARLMPVPGKQAGDPTEFEFDYFANSVVMPIPSTPLTGLLAGEETLPLRTYDRGG